MCSLLLDLLLEAKISHDHEDEQEPTNVPLLSMMRMCDFLYWAATAGKNKAAIIMHA